MDNVTVKEKVVIENLIYEVRGTQVMLDSDLARLYECVNGTKTINQSVKRNIERFPDDFYFQLTKAEFQELQSQIGTTNLNKMSRTLPCVLTEQGVVMLATVLRTSVASQMSASIMRAFVTMRKFISTNLIEQKYTNNQVLKNTEDIKLLQEFEEKRKDSEIYFNGQIFDAYSKIYEIFNSANEYLIIIDIYADNTLLDIIKRLSAEVVIITKRNNLLTEQDITKYNKQYHNLKVIYDNTFHDRYFFIVIKQVYHCGTSINRIGYKTFSINLISDEEICNSLISKINKII